MEVHLFVAAAFFVWLIVAKLHSYSHYKIAVSYTIVRYNLLRQFLYFGGPPMAMDAMLATIANGGQAIVDINREAGRN